MDTSSQEPKDLAPGPQSGVLEPALEGRRILITGAGAFIAGHLAERLLQQGSKVRGLVRSPAKASWLATQGVDVTAGDLRDPDALYVAATDCWAVVHAAAWTGGASLDAGEGWRINVEGTRNALAAARRANAQRFVYISSVAVYGLNAAPIIDEAMPIVPVGEAYPDSKIAAEGAVRASGLPYVIVRPASTYGPRGGAWTLSPIQHIKHNRLVLLGRDAGLVTPGYIDNLVDGLLLTLSSPAALGEAFNLCDDRAVTYRTFYMAYAHMLGRERLPTLPAGWPGWQGLALGASRAASQASGQWDPGHSTFGPIHRSTASAKPKGC